MAEQFEVVKHSMLNMFNGTVSNAMHSSSGLHLHVCSCIEYVLHSKPVNRSFSFLVHIPGLIWHDSICFKNDIGVLRRSQCMSRQPFNFFFTALCKEYKILNYFEKGTLCDELFPRSAWVHIWGKH